MCKGKKKSTDYYNVLIAYRKLCCEAFVNISSLKYKKFVFYQIKTIKL